MWKKLHKNATNPDFAVHYQTQEKKIKPMAINHRKSDHKNNTIT